MGDISDKNTYKLYAWPGSKNRGEYIRLVFEEAGVPYIDVGASEGANSIAKFCWEGGNKHFPVRAPPAISKANFVLSFTNVILSYLNKSFAWGPQNLESQSHVEQILAVVADAVSEGYYAFHPTDLYAADKVQMENCKPYLQQYGEQRLPKYMQHFEAILKQNGGTPEAPGFLIGSSITAADLAVYQYLVAAEQHFEQYYNGEHAQVAKAFKRTIEQRPRIAAYLASDRCPRWDKHSMM